MLTPLQEKDLASLHASGSFDELNRNIGYAVGWLTAAIEDILGHPGSNLAMSPTGGWYQIR